MTTMPGVLATSRWVHHLKTRKHDLSSSANGFALTVDRNGPKGYKYKPWSMDEFMERDVPLDEGDWS